MAIQTFTALQVLTAAQQNALQANDYNQTVSTKTASYTLVAADKGTRIAMNSATATTITVNTSLFAAGDTLQIVNISSGVCTVTAGTATVSTSGSLALVANAGGVLYFTSAGVAIFLADGVTASGLVCIKAQTAFSAVAAITLDSIFTSTYTNYKIVVSFANTAAAVMGMQLRVAGVASTTGYNMQGFSAISASLGAGRVNSSSWRVTADSGTLQEILEIELFNPQLAQPTFAKATNILNVSTTVYTAEGFELDYGNHSVATAYDGFSLTPASGTTTGFYTVYGYSKAV